MKIQTLLIPVVLIQTALFSASLTDYVDTSKCDKIIDKQLYKICYSNKNKGALAGWVKLDGKKVNAVNIKKRPRFYNESNIICKYSIQYINNISQKLYNIN